MMAMDLLRLEGDWTLQMGGRWWTLSNACSSQRCAFFFSIFLGTTKDKKIAQGQKCGVVGITHCGGGDRFKCGSGWTFGSILRWGIC